MALYTDGQPREKEENELELSLPTPLRIAYWGQPHRHQVKKLVFPQNEKNELILTVER